MGNSLFKKVFITSITLLLGFSIGFAQVDLSVLNQNYLPMGQTFSPGVAFRIQTTVKNGGAAIAPASKLRVYLSFNNTYEPLSDVFLGEESIGSIPPNSSVSSNVSSLPVYTIPSTQALGEYYLIAVADGNNEIVETDEANNVHAAKITVEAPKIDLVYSGMFMSGASYAASGTAFSVTTTVNNTGSSPSGNFTISYYLSTNTSYDAADVLLGAPSFPSIAYLSSGNCAGTLTIPANMAQGEYYLISVIDFPNSIQELNESNNSGYMTFTVLKTGIDLAIKSVSLPNGTSIKVGETFAISCQAFNYGTSWSGSGAVGYYLSIDDVYDISDVYLGNSTFSGMSVASGQASTTNLVIPATTPYGFYNIIAKADYQNLIAESDEANNSNALLVSVGKSKGDMIITSVNTSASSVAAGNSFNATSVINIYIIDNSWGTVKVGYYLSSDNVYDNSDVFLGEKSFEATALAGVSSLGVSASLTIPVGTMVGSYYIVSKVDYQNLINEDNEDNNTGYRAITVTPPNQLPLITLTSPVPGFSAKAPAFVPIMANASDPDGTISRVEFYNGGTLLGTSMSSPYNYYWANVVSGSYVITAKAYDNNNAVSTSLPVTVIVYNAPVVNISNPLQGAVFTTPASVSVTANASVAGGTIQKVEFYNGATLLGTANASPYSYTWASIPAGTYNLTAKATSNTGYSTTSSAVSFTVNPLSNVAPVLHMTSPVPNAVFTAPASVTISANASDTDGSISKVEFYNGETLLSILTTPPYTYIWEGVTPGVYNIMAKVYDNLNEQGAASVVPITVNPPANVAPAVSITSPVNNASLAVTETINVTADATDSDGNITKVEFFNGSTKLGEDLTSPYVYNWTGIIAGNYTITAKAYDNAGAATVSASVSFEVINTMNNLEVSTLAVPQTVVGAGQALTVNATLSNTSSTLTSSSGTVSYYLSVNNTYEATDVYLDKSNFSAINANGTANLSASLTIPENTEEGEYYILAVVDGKDEIPVTTRLADGTVVKYVKITVTRTTAVNDLILSESQVSLYPNPATSVVTIKTGRDAHIAGAVNVKTLYGVSVFSQTVYGEASLDLSHLTNGIYLVEISNGQQVNVLKLVKE